MGIGAIGGFDISQGVLSQGIRGGGGFRWGICGDEGAGGIIFDSLIGLV